VATTTYQSSVNPLAPGDKKADQGHTKTEDDTKAKVAKNEIADPAKLQQDSWSTEATQFLKKAKSVVSADGSLIMHNLYDEVANSAAAKAVKSSVNALHDEVANSAVVKSVESSVNTLRNEVTNSAPVKAVKNVANELYDEVSYSATAKAAGALYTEVTQSAPAKAITDLVTTVANSEPFKTAEKIAYVGAMTMLDPFAGIYAANSTFFDDKQNFTDTELDQKLQVAAIDNKMNPEFIGKMKEGIAQAFNASYENAGGSSKTLTADAQALETQREIAVKNHKPETKWFENGKLYELKANGDLLIYKDENDMQWIGQDGSQYEKKNGEQIWRKGGREIKADQGVYTYRAADGSYKVIDGNAKKLVERVGGVLFSFTAKAEVTLDVTRTAIMGVPDGVHGHGNAMSVLKTDKFGNRILFDSLYGVFIFGKDGNNYHLERDGSLWSTDEKGVRHQVKDIPGVLTRDADGTFRFGTIKIEKDGSFLDSERELRMSGNTITWKDQGHTYKEVLENGHWHEFVDGKMTGDADVKTGDIKILEDGKTVLNYNFETKKMHAFGITFSPQGTKIDGTDFSISNAGVVKFDNGTSWAGSANAGMLTDSSTREAAAAVSGAVSDVLGLATSISGKAQSEITEADVSVLLGLYMELGAIGASMPADATTSAIIANGLQSLGSRMDAASTRAKVNEDLRARGVTVAQTI
jgi:hypothetical protein